VLNGNHHDFGKANFIKTKNSPKNINNGTISFSTFEKKFSSSVFIFISVFQFKLIQISVRDVFVGFSDSKVLYIFSVNVFCIIINEFQTPVHKKVYQTSCLSFITSILLKSFFLYFSTKLFKESSFVSLIFSTLSHDVFEFA